MLNKHQIILIVIVVVGFLISWGLSHQSVKEQEPKSPYDTMTPEQQSAADMVEKRVQENLAKYVAEFVPSMEDDFSGDQTENIMKAGVANIRRNKLKLDHPPSEHDGEVMLREAVSRVNEMMKSTFLMAHPDGGLIEDQVVPTRSRPSGRMSDELNRDWAQLDRERREEEPNPDLIPNGHESL